MTTKIYDGAYKSLTDYISGSILEINYIHWTWVAFWVSTIMVTGQILVWVLEEVAKSTPFIQVTG